MARYNKFRYALFVFLCSLFIMHIMLFVAMLSSTRIYSFFSFTPAGQYKINAVLGPFFDEARIGSTCKLHYRTFDDGNWSGWTSPEDINFAAYHANYLRFDLLKKNQHESVMVYRVLHEINEDSTKHFKEMRAFQNLDRYLHDQYIVQKVDSVELLYRCFYDFNGGDRDTDTLYHISYTP